MKVIGVVGTSCASWKASTSSRLVRRLSSILYPLRLRSDRDLRPNGQRCPGIAIRYSDAVLLSPRLFSRAACGPSIMSVAVMFRLFQLSEGQPERIQNVPSQTPKA